MGLKSNDRCVYERKAEGDLSHRVTQEMGEGHVSVEAETGFLAAQAEVPQRLPEAGRSKEAFFPGAFRENMTLTLDLWPPQL